MYKFYKDKNENFECNIGIEGASLSNAKARLVLENEEFNLIFEYYENFQNLNKKDKERFITLTCIVKGQEYTQTVKKSNKKINITTEDINLVVNKVLTEMKISIEDLKKYK